MSTAVVLTLASLAAAKRYLGSRALRKVAVRYINRIEFLITYLIDNERKVLR
jgi:hypothetical protein